MRIRILKAGKYPWGIVESSALMELSTRCKDQQFMGQLIKEDEEFKGVIDAQKITHYVKNISFNPLTLEVWGDVEFASTPYGVQLEALIKKSPKKINFRPVYSYDDAQTVITSLTFITANAILKVKKK